MIPTATQMQQKSLKYAEANLSPALLRHVASTIEAAVGTLSCRFVNLTTVEAHYLATLLTLYGYKVEKYQDFDNLHWKIFVFWSPQQDK